MSTPEKTLPTQPVPAGDAANAHLKTYMASKLKEVVNAYALCNALFTFTESKLLDDLRKDGWIDAAASAARHKYDPHQTLGLLRYLAMVDIFKEREKFIITPYGETVFSQLPVAKVRHFRGGYGNLMHQAGKLLDGTLKYGKDISRDGFYVSTASNDISSAIFDNVPHSLAERFGAKTMLDIGCGAARFLIDFVKRSPKHRGIGIDNYPPSIEEARAAVARAGLSDRIELHVAEAADMGGWAKKCQHADMLFAFGIQHEILRDGEQAVLDHIDQLAAAFPGKRFLVGEPLERWRDEPGFYWMHILSGQGIPRSIDGWVPLFKRLKRARLDGVYAPDHEKGAGYFSILF